MYVRQFMTIVWKRNPELRNNACLPRLSAVRRLLDLVEPMTARILAADWILRLMELDCWITGGFAPGRQCKVKRTLQHDENITGLFLSRLDPCD